MIATRKEEEGDDKRRIKRSCTLCISGTEIRASRPQRPGVMYLTENHIVGPNQQFEHNERPRKLLVGGPVVPPDKPKQAAAWCGPQTRSQAFLTPLPSSGRVPLWRVYSLNCLKLPKLVTNVLRETPSVACVCVCVFSLSSPAGLQCSEQHFQRHRAGVCVCVCVC